MRYSQCKCGKRQHWGSGMQPNLCDPCVKCGSIPAESPSTHPDPVPHDFSAVQMVETDEGKKPLTRCRHCFMTAAEIAERQKRELEG